MRNCTCIYCEFYFSQINVHYVFYTFVILFKNLSSKTYKRKKKHECIESIILFPFQSYGNVLKKK